MPSAFVLFVFPWTQKKDLCFVLELYRTTKEIENGNMLQNMTFELLLGNKEKKNSETKVILGQESILVRLGNMDFLPSVPVGFNLMLVAAEEQRAT